MIDVGGIFDAAMGLPPDDPISSLARLRVGLVPRPTVF